MKNATLDVPLDKLDFVGREERNNNTYGGGNNKREKD